ncbi:MAG TPA: NADH:ubiquinone oxidoreductase subunit NDUFA12 [Rhodospirillaceae bacterium]|jgi:NADH:ubiquinone oxidoreductase subunit|nr:NADH:ubiquinone oxidoreductase subunit NDUFA12 [Alphaproteobacteria bacterium]HBH27168.1 NADH:ubiquinone oxidoreductase subunit NDUFA12 [Rhodospirillaceae bacterium]
MVKTLLRLLGAQSPAYQALFTWRRARQRVGTDPLGNTYYEAPARPGYDHPRRWVAYRGRPDPSAIPPRWHAWLHHQAADFPTQDGPSRAQPWQKPHAPNPTGGPGAYHPPGDLRRGTAQRAPATGDYRPWTPGEDTA